MRQWVNDSLAGYSSIAEADVQIAALMAQITEGNEDMSTIEALLRQLSSLKGYVDISYEDAISDAITLNNGVIDEKIAGAINKVNRRIDDELMTINSRLDAIEDRLDEIEETLGNLVKQIQSLENVQYTPMVTSAEDAITKLVFRVNPKSAVKDLVANWEEYATIKGYYSDNVTNIFNLPIVSFEDNDNGFISIKASGDNLSAEFFTGLQKLSIYLEISDGNNDIASESIAIEAQRWMNDKIDATPADGEVYYTTSSSRIITSDALSEDQIISNLYDKKRGIFVIKYHNNIIKIADKSFTSKSY